MVRKRWYQWMIEPLRNYGRIANRASRAEYWWYGLFCLVVTLLAVVSDILLRARHGRDGPIETLIWLALLMPSLGVSIRRLHDVGRSGWWLLAPYAVVLGASILATVGSSQITSIPRLGDALLALTAIGIFIPVSMALIWQFVDGTSGPNRYGSDPKPR